MGGLINLEEFAALVKKSAETFAPKGGMITCDFVEGTDSFVVCAWDLSELGTLDESGEVDEEGSIMEVVVYVPPDELRGNAIVYKPAVIVRVDMLEAKVLVFEQLLFSIMAEIVEYSRKLQKMLDSYVIKDSAEGVTYENEVPQGSSGS